MWRCRWCLADIAILHAWTLNAESEEDRFQLFCSTERYSELSEDTEQNRESCLCHAKCRIHRAHQNKTISIQFHSRCSSGLRSVWENTFAKIYLFRFHECMLLALIWLCRECVFRNYQSQISKIFTTELSMALELMVTFQITVAVPQLISNKQTLKQTDTVRYSRYI